MGFITSLATALAIAFVIIGIGSLGLSLERDERDSLTSKVTADPIGAGGAAAEVVIGYDYVTPAYQVEWIGSSEDKTWMLEDIPFPDSKDFLFLILPWLGFAILGRYLINNMDNKFLAVLAVIGIFVFGTLIIWVVGKTIAYYVMLHGADTLGIRADVISAREAAIALAQNTGATIYLVGLSIVTIAIGAAALIPSDK